MRLQISSPTTQKLSFELEQYAKLPEGKSIIYTKIDAREVGAKGMHHLYYMDNLTVTYTDVFFPFKVELDYDLNRNFIVIVFIIEGSSKDVEEGSNGAQHIYNTNEYSIAFRPERKGALHLPVNKQVKALRIVFDPQFFFERVDSQSHFLLQKFSNKIKEKESSRLFPYNGFITADMHNVIQQMINTDKKDNLLKLLFEVKCLELLLMILEKYDEYDKSPLKSSLRKEDSLIKARNFLENSNGKITLEQVARYAGSNVASLKRDFRKYYDSTVMDYWKKIKMREVHEKLLADEDYTPKQAAALMGYKHTHHFSKAFEQEFGYTPTLLVKSNK